MGVEQAYDAESIGSGFQYFQEDPLVACGRVAQLVLSGEADPSVLRDFIRGDIDDLAVLLPEKDVGRLKVLLGNLPQEL